MFDSALVRHCSVAALLTGVFGCAPRPLDQTNETPWASYVGRYAHGPDMVLEVYDEEGFLAVRPSFWRTPLILEQRGEDEFVGLQHDRFRFSFRRDGEGRVIALEAEGSDDFQGESRRLGEEERLPVEVLLARDGAGAAAALARGEGVDEGRISRLGFAFLLNFPSRANVAVEFLEAFESTFSESADLHVALAHASMIAGERDQARESFERARALEPDNSTARLALQHLGAGPQDPGGGWQLSFETEALFAAPSTEEMDSVRLEWAQRDLRPAGVEFVAEEAVEIQGGRFRRLVLSHEVEGERHFGVVLVPEGSEPGCCPVVLELRGVSAHYSPLDVDRARVPLILDQDLSRVILVLPSFRGNTIIVSGESYLSEGTPTRAWDGATDDALALLNVVLQQVPEADGDRVCAYGKSRGGTVALLVGERDPRVDCVVDWAGPSGWFEHMGTFGWTIQEQVEWALREEWEPGHGWGSSDQFIDHFLLDAIAGEGDLGQTRRQVLASSPLYFVDFLPAAQLQYGVEDRSVYVANALALRDALESRKSSAPTFEVVLHEGVGHDMPYPRAHRATRRFLVQQLFDSDPG